MLLCYIVNKYHTAGKAKRLAQRVPFASLDFFTGRWSREAWAQFKVEPGFFSFYLVHADEPGNEVSSADNPATKNELNE